MASLDPLSPISPIDPFLSSLSSGDPFDQTSRVDQSQPTRYELLITDKDLLGSDKRLTTGTEFFSALFLDSPRLEEMHYGSTKPLRVRKREVSDQSQPDKSMANQRRRSALSLPQSPSSPQFDCAILSPTRLKRNDSTSTETSRAHHAISELFLASSPLIMSPPPLPTKPNYRFQDQSARDFSLDIDPRFPVSVGSFDQNDDFDFAVAMDDACAIGPSPAGSPPMSADSPFRDGWGSGGKTLPTTPVTPSRAPSKAIKLLGASEGFLTSSKIKRYARNKHFRPLPSHAKVNDPARPSKLPARLRRNHADKEQDSAWLMADLKAGPKFSPTSPSYGSVIHALGNNKTGMAVSATSFSISPALKGKKSKATILRPKGESFMDFDETPSPASIIPRRAPKSSPPVSSNKKVPLGFTKLDSRDLLVPPARTTSQNHSTTKDIVEQQPFPVRPARPIRTDSEFSEGSGSDDSSKSKSRKARPPPLTLRPRMPNPHLPIVSHTPSPAGFTGNGIPLPISENEARRTERRNRIQPLLAASPVRSRPQISIETPFVRPRQAPLPVDITIPVSSVYDLPPIIYQPPPKILPSPRSPDFEGGYSGGDSCSPSLSLIIQDVSCFDPVTPISPRPQHHRVFSGSSAGAVAVAVGNIGVSGVKNSGAWLKKVVGGKREKGVRI